MTKEKITKGYKGFDKDLKCRDFQYKEGETYETDQKPVRCTENGFHFCTEPIDVFGYYDPANSIFHEVEGFGETSTDDSDSKIAVSKIKIGAEISLFDMVKIGVDMILKRCKKDTEKLIKDSSAAVNSGDRSAAVNSGDSSAAVNSGDRSAAEVTGKHSIACGFGIENKAKGSLGCWLVLTEWVHEGEWQIKNLKSVKVDGKKIKADTWYMLKDNKIIEA